MIYTATITSGGLRPRESKIIAQLRLDCLEPKAYLKSLYDENVLQLRSTETIRRIANLIKSRLDTLTKDQLEMVCSEDRIQSNQTLLAAAINHSRLLGDFLDIAVREHWSGYERVITPHCWQDYLDGCQGRDPDMPNWSESTRNRLRSSVYSILAEADYIESTRTRVLQRVFVDKKVHALLSESGNHYTLRCMEVTS